MSDSKPKKKTLSPEVRLSKDVLGPSGSQCGPLPKISTSSSTKELEYLAQIAMMKIVGRELLHSALRDGPDDKLITQSVNLFGSPLDKEDLPKILESNRAKRNVQK